MPYFKDIPAALQSTIKFKVSTSVTWGAADTAQMEYNEHGLHNASGPAVISDTTWQWWLHGELHRIDGPAYVQRLRNSEHLTYRTKYYLHGMCFEPKSFYTFTDNKNPVAIASKVISTMTQLVGREFILEHIKLVLKSNQINDSVLKQLMAIRMLIRP